MNSGKYEIKEGRLVNKQTGVPIPDDEPVFILRAQDAHSTTAVLEYGVICGNTQIAIGVGEVLEQFKIWQKANPDKVKEPD